MSFEGYYQLLCKKGHFYQTSLYNSEENTPCPVCQEECVWWNLVDTTNDSGNPIELKLKTQKSCDKCNSILEEIYEIPKTGHRKIMNNE